MTHEERERWVDEYLARHPESTLRRAEGRAVLDAVEKHREKGGPRVRARFKLTGEEHTLSLKLDHSCSSYGQPVLVNEDGEAVDPFSWNFYELTEATEADKDALCEAGYFVAD